MGCAPSQPRPGKEHKVGRVNGGEAELSERGNTNGEAGGSWLRLPPRPEGGTALVSTFTSKLELPKVTVGAVAPSQTVPASPGGSPARRERRLGFGSEVVREQLRHLTLGSRPGEEADGFVEVGPSSEDEAHPATTQPPRRMPSGQLAAKPVDLLERLCAGLQRSFVFHGIDKRQLQQVVSRMHRVCYQAGEVLVRQGSPLEADDCLCYVAEGTVSVSISGGANDAALLCEEDVAVSGNAVQYQRSEGWLFGEAAVLFSSPSSATVAALTDVTLYTMSRRTVLQLVMKHAPGARALRFLRKLPILRGLPDSGLLALAPHMSFETFQDGQQLIGRDQACDRLMMVRNGCVRVVWPAGGQQLEQVALLRRGAFVGDRMLVNGKLRSALCIAEGEVHVISLPKTLLDSDNNPVLSWMLDYNAIATVLKEAKLFSHYPADHVDSMMDVFEREELRQGDLIAQQGEVLHKLYLLRSGQLAASTSSGAGNEEEPIALPAAGGFAYFGAKALEEDEVASCSVRVASDSAVLLTLSRAALKGLLAASGKSRRLTGVSKMHEKASGRRQLTQEESALALKALQQCPLLQPLSQAQLGQLVRQCEMRQYSRNQPVAHAADLADRLYLVSAGECALVQDGSVGGLDSLVGPGQLVEEQALLRPFRRTAALIATLEATQVLVLKRAAAEKALGGSVQEVLRQRADAAKKRLARTVSQQEAGRQQEEAAAVQLGIRYQELEMHRVVGTGQFGLVRLVRHRPTGAVYALKVMHKASISEAKQVEHIVNERRIMEEAGHPFCVRLLRSFQDRTSLYLLQEWIPGGELFHHLDLEGAFDEATAQFYAACVLLALEALHQGGTVYRDLKPENLLLDERGYIKVADFGFAKKLGAGEKTYTICGTPDYQAPEVIMRKGTGRAADYWALGILVFELLVGEPPFKSGSGDPWDTFRRTLAGRFAMPAFVSETAADLVYQLLQVNPERRLGSGPSGAEEVKSHRWFAGIDWAALERRALPAPIIPSLASPLDTSNFDEFDEPPGPPPYADPVLGDPHAADWDGWDWIGEPPLQRHSLRSDASSGSLASVMSGGSFSSLSSHVSGGGKQQEWGRLHHTASGGILRSHHSSSGADVAAAPRGGGRLTSFASIT